ncbi:MAG: hypothetical protein JWN04_1909 [Myxococcaceae bacterium]|nr:hypothetical protein [Myxococcaceae bacterium]
MRHRIGLLLFAVTLGSISISSRAAAEPYRDHDDAGDVRLYGGLGLGFGGTADVNAHGALGVFSANGSDDLITSVGGQVGVDVPVLRYLSLGAEARLLSFNTKPLDDNNVDRSKLLDIDFKPRLRLPLRNAPLEFYLTVPVGVTVPFLASQFTDTTKVDAKTGWNIGVGAGVNWWLARAFALNFEPMFLFHKFNFNGAAGTNGDITLRQFTMFINAVVAL